MSLGGDNFEIWHSHSTRVCQHWSKYDKSLVPVKWVLY